MRLPVKHLADAMPEYYRLSPIVGDIKSNMADTSRVAGKIYFTCTKAARPRVAATATAAAASAVDAL